MALAWFTARAVGTLVGPFAILMAFMAFAPSAFAYPWVVFGSSIAVGLASCYPRRFDPRAMALRVAYLIVMLEALLWWTLVSWARFPQIWPYMKIDL